MNFSYSWKIIFFIFLEDNIFPDYSSLHIISAGVGRSDNSMFCSGENLIICIYMYAYMYLYM